MVQSKLSIADSDFEIETNTLKVSLMCPLIKFRIQLPARARHCKHVQCFDLESYLLMNEKKPGWLCPVCDGSAPYDTLIIDGLFREILAKVKDAEEIEFTPDGEWTRVATGSGDKKAEKQKSVPKKEATVFTGEEICCDDGDDATDSMAAASAPSVSHSSSQLNGHSGMLLINNLYKIKVFIRFKSRKNEGFSDEGIYEGLNKNENLQ
jgi:hypothetical protein